MFHLCVYTYFFQIAYHTFPICNSYPNVKNCFVAGPFACVKMQRNSPAKIRIPRLVHNLTHYTIKC